MNTSNDFLRTLKNPITTLPYQDVAICVKNVTDVKLYGQMVTALEVLDEEQDPIIINKSIENKLNESPIKDKKEMHLISSFGFEENELVYIPRHRKFLWAAPAGIVPVTLSSAEEFDSNIYWWWCQTASHDHVPATLVLSDMSEVMRLKSFVNAEDMSFIFNGVLHNMTLTDEGQVKVTGGGNISYVPPEVFFEVGD